MMGALHLMNRTGDTTVEWHTENEAEVGAAREHFRSLVAQGWSAFRVVGANKQGERMTAFDPEAGKVIMVPQMAGG